MKSQIIVLYISIYMVEKRGGRFWKLVLSEAGSVMRSESLHCLSLLYQRPAKAFLEERFNLGEVEGGCSALKLPLRKGGFTSSLFSPVSCVGLPELSASSC